MERRNFVIGLGGIAASAGLVAGSGAFSQIEADRSMTVTVADDSDAYISLTPTTEAGDYAITNGNGDVELLFDAGAGNAGINDNATSYFDSLVEIKNNVEQEVTIQLAVDSAVSDPVITLYEGTSRDTELTSTTLAMYDGTAGGSVIFGVKIDTTNASADTSYSPTITITAN